MKTAHNGAVKYKYINMTKSNSRSTKIEWTEKTWNPVTGCSKISAGCANCYAEKMSNRLKAMGQKKYSNGFAVTLHDEVLNEPISWRKPHTVFVCSMSDLFHDSVPFEFIDKVMTVITSTPKHTYQLLTKRAERMSEYFATRSIPKNAWLGVTVDVAKSKSRIDHLRSLNATVKFLSCEPLLEDLGALNLDRIDWVIVGGESGNQARPMKEEWVLSIQKQCEEQGSAFFFKQWGTWGADGVKRSKKANGKELRGKVYQAMPNVKLLNNNHLTKNKMKEVKEIAAHDTAKKSKLERAIELIPTKVMDNEIYINRGPVLFGDTAVVFYVPVDDSIDHCTAMLEADELSLCLLYSFWEVKKRSEEIFTEEFCQKSHLGKYVQSRLDNMDEMPDEESKGIGSAIECAAIIANSLSELSKKQIEEIEKASTSVKVQKLLEKYLVSTNTQF